MGLEAHASSLPLLTSLTKRSNYLASRKRTHSACVWTCWGASATTFVGCGGTVCLQRQDRVRDFSGDDHDGSTILLRDEQ